MYSPQNTRAKITLTLPSQQQNNSDGTQFHFDTHSTPVIDEETTMFDSSPYSSFIPPAPPPPNNDNHNHNHNHTDDEEVPPPPDWDAEDEDEDQEPNEDTDDSRSRSRSRTESDSDHDPENYSHNLNINGHADDEFVNPSPVSSVGFRQHPRGRSQSDFNDFLQKRTEDEKDNQFDAHINAILSAFSKQYPREYIKMKIKSAVYDMIDKELNRKSFSNYPNYRHLKRKRRKPNVLATPRQPQKHSQSQPVVQPPQPRLNASSNNSFSSSAGSNLSIPTSPTPIPISPTAEENAGFQPVYSLRIATSRTEIGADKNEYTSYIIIGSRISPKTSKLTVCVKRFVELRKFATELQKIRPTLKTKFPYHGRLFNSIDTIKLEKRRSEMDAYLNDICSDEITVCHHTFLSFFAFNETNAEELIRLTCIEDTLEIIGMSNERSGNNDSHYDDSSDSSDSSDGSDDGKANDSRSGGSSANSERRYRDVVDNDLSFEVPYDLHHYRKPDYKLIAAIFDIIQQQLENEESYQEAMPSELNLNLNPILPHVRPRAISDGRPANIRHMRTTSIIESSFVPAKPLEFHPSISTKGTFNPIPSNNALWTASAFKSKFHSSICGLDGGPRIIRSADEATSDKSLSYQIPTKVAYAWQKIMKSVSRKSKAVPILLTTLKKDMYPIIQETVNDVVPIVKALFAFHGGKQLNTGVADGVSVHHMHEPSNLGQKIVNNNNNSNSNSNRNRNRNQSNRKTPATNSSDDSEHDSSFPNHTKILSLYGHGYDGDEDDSTDSDSDEVPRSIGIRHFPFIKAMQQYCNKEQRLYEYLLAFENLAIDNIFGDKNLQRNFQINAQTQKLPGNALTVSSSVLTPFTPITAAGISGFSYAHMQSHRSRNSGGGSTRGGLSPLKDRTPRKLKFNLAANVASSADSSSSLYNNLNTNFANSAEKIEDACYQYVHLLTYNYKVLKTTCNAEFGERISHIERIHHEISLILCEIVYSILKTFMKCMGNIVLYKDTLEERFENCSNTFTPQLINAHEDQLLSILRDAGYSVSFIVDDLAQKIKSEFKDYTSVIAHPLLEGVTTIGELTLNCLCSMISEFVFDDGEFPVTIDELRAAFLHIWVQPINYYISDLTECVFYILYQSSIGLVHSASHGILEDYIYNDEADEDSPQSNHSNHASHANHTNSIWYQLLRRKKVISRQKSQVSHDISTQALSHKYIPSEISRTISIKDILKIVIERTLTNIVDETLIYVRTECEKAFFTKLEKQRKTQS